MDVSIDIREGQRAALPTLSRLHPLIQPGATTVALFTDYLANTLTRNWHATRVFGGGSREVC